MASEKTTQDDAHHDNIVDGLRAITDWWRAPGWMAGEAADEIERLRAEVASLRLTLGGRTFSADVPEPIGCPAPGACAQVAEIGRLRGVIRANALRWNPAATHAEIEEVIYGKR